MHRCGAAAGLALADTDWRGLKLHVPSCAAHVTNLLDARNLARDLHRHATWRRSASFSSELGCNFRSARLAAALRRALARARTQRAGVRRPSVEAPDVLFGMSRCDLGVLRGADLRGAVPPEPTPRARSVPVKQRCNSVLALSPRCPFLIQPCALAPSCGLRGRAHSCAAVRLRPHVARQPGCAFAPVSIDESSKQNRSRTRARGVRCIERRWRACVCDALCS